WEGNEADARSDIFAFGAVLYELLTGQKAFDGKTPASVIAAIMERDPPAVSSVEPMTPPLLDRVVRKCLAKDPDGRWQSVGDLRDELVWIAEGGTPASMPAVPATPARKPLLLLGAMLALVALVVGWLLPSPFANPTPAALHPLRLHVPLPENASAYYDIAISPDGGHLAYTVRKAGEIQLWLHDLTDDTTQLVTSTAVGVSPFWSPDSRFLAFFSDGKLKWVDVSRKITQTVCDLPGRPKGGTWSRTGTILFSIVDLESLGLYRVSS
ncbi:MAG: protein kinase, partial [bacterium]|nr:protein kinase [bacterium]